MLIGSARVSTAEQNPAHQTDALRRADVAEADIYVDHASQRMGSRRGAQVLVPRAGGEAFAVASGGRLDRSWTSSDGIPLSMEVLP